MNPIDVMTYGHRQLMELVDRLRPADWSVIALGTWDAKDLVGHLGAFEVRFAEVLAAFVGDEPGTDLARTDPAAFNDVQAAVRKDWAVDQVLAELKDAHRRVMDRARRIPGETWTAVGTVPWYGPGYALDDLLVYSIYGHKREHAPQLDAVLDRVGR